MTPEKTDIPSQPTWVEVKRLTDVLDKIHDDIYSMDSKSPGVMFRMYRLESKFASALSVIKWIGSGGLVGLFGAVYLLYRLLENFTPPIGH